MKLSRQANAVLESAIQYAAKNGYEFVTPETILLFLCRDNDFSFAFYDCCGDIKQLEEDLTGYIEQNVDITEGETDFSVSTIRMLSSAEVGAVSSEADEILISHLVRAIFTLKDSYAVYYMQKQGVTEVDLLISLAEINEMNDSISRKYEKDNSSPSFDENDFSRDEPEEKMSKEEKMPKEKSNSSLTDYAPCLNETLKNVNPLIGREEELQRTIQILCRKDKNNPLHIGDPGVGKTAITYGLVQRINEGKVPRQLLGSRVYAMDLGSMLAGTQYRGEFEKRFKKVLAELEKEETPIVFLDEIHNLSGAGSVEGNSMDAANLLKAHLADGHIRFIGATTFEEYKKYFEKDKSLVRRFQNVEIREPSIAQTVEILKGLRENYESFHQVVYSDEIIEYIVAMSAKHIHERFLPDKAIDIMDEAGSYRKLHPTRDHSVDKDVVNSVLTSICRVPVEQVDADNLSGLETLEKRILSNVFGQDEAVSQVVNAIKFSKAGLLEEEKPLASLLFVGPTGVGKTEIAKCLARELGVKLVRFDMSEYGEKHTISKLIGSPAGYVGYEEGGLLTEEIRKNPSCVLLLDEIEKAHADIYNVLLQVMDYATLTDNQGRKADFRNVIIIMTSNAGAGLLGKPGIGFTAENADRRVLDEEIKRVFQPEFRNRLNRIVMFHSMDDAMGEKVIEKKIRELSELLLKKNVKLTVTKEAKKLLKKKGISTEFGAREVERVVRNEIKPLLVDDLLFGTLSKGGKVTLSARNNEFTFAIKNA